MASREGSRRRGARLVWLLRMAVAGSALILLLAGSTTEARGFGGHAGAAGSRGGHAMMVGAGRSRAGGWSGGHVSGWAAPRYGGMYRYGGVYPRYRAGLPFRHSFFPHPSFFPFRHHFFPHRFFFPFSLSFFLADPFYAPYYAYYMYPYYWYYPYYGYPYYYPYYEGAPGSQYEAPSQSQPYYGGDWDSDDDSDW